MRAVDRGIYEQVVSGVKTVETRAATDKYRVIEAGDTITFKCEKDEVIRSVSRVEHFNSLEEMFNHIPMEKILPQASDIDKARAIYYGFPHYKEKIAEHGIMAFTLAD